MYRKGIVIDKYTKENFKNSQIKAFSKYMYFFDMDTDIKTINKFIKENDIPFVMIPFTPNLNKDFKNLKAHKYVSAGDTPRRMSSKQFKEFYKSYACEGIVTFNHSCIDPLYDYMNPIVPDIFYYNWGIDLNIFKEYDIKKSIDVLQTGKFSNYQYRSEIHSMFSSIKDFDYSYKRMKATDNQSHIEYAKTLASAHIGIGGCMQPKNLTHYKDKLISDNFPKNYEIPACMSCLMNSEWGDREYLGFENGENCIIFNSVRDARRKVNYYLEDADQLYKITVKGHSLINKNHNIDKCVSDLVKAMGDK